MYLFQQRFPQDLSRVSCRVKERKKDCSHGIVQMRNCTWKVGKKNKIVWFYPGIKYGGWYNATHLNRSCICPCI